MLFRVATAVEVSNSPSLIHQNRDPGVGPLASSEHSEQWLCACIPTPAASPLTCVAVTSFLPVSEHHRKGQVRSEDFVDTRPEGESTKFHEISNQTYGTDLFSFLFSLSQYQIISVT